jgi:hypothetical protein
MPNGEMLAELQLLLQQEKIPANVAQRMTLAAVTEVLKDTGVLTERTDIVIDQITCLQGADEKILVVVEQHSRILELWGTNPGRNFVAWCGKHVRFTLIILTTIAIIVAVDVIQGGYWSEILVNVDGWLKYLKMVL